MIMNKIFFRIRGYSIYDWECLMLVLAVILVPFHNGHKFLTIPFTGNMGSKLTIYPVIIGLCLFVYRVLKERKFHLPKSCIIFFITFLVWQIISLLHGLFIFPDWQEITSDQFNKLTFLLLQLAEKGISIDPVSISRLWWSLKLIINHIIEYFVSYGAVLWIISLFYQNKKQAFDSFFQGILVGAIVCSVYSLVEFLYLLGSYDAMSILTYINPLIYDVGIAHGWWPPLLGGNRVRSVFAEPAFMALYLTVTIPFLYAQIYKAKTKKWFWKIIFAIQIIMMWGTNSKTAMGILIAEGIAACIFLYLYRRQLSLKKCCYPLMAVILLCGVGVGVNWVFQHRYAVDYELISISSDDRITLRVTNKSDTIWEKRTGIGLSGSCFTEDWQDEYERIEVPLNRTLFPHQSCDITFKLPMPDDKDEYPIAFIELEANNEFQKETKLSGLGAASFTLRWNHGQWLEKGESQPIENKMTALTSKTEGSNQQRYGLMYVETLIGLDHPIFGVGGQELKQAYFITYIPDWLMKNKEIQLWVAYQESKGLLKAGFPVLGDYTHQFASYGFPGFILFLLPSFYGVVLLIKKKKYWLDSYFHEYLYLAVLSISYFGLMVAFVGGNSIELYIYWLLLGVLLGYYGTLGCKDRN